MTEDGVKERGILAAVCIHRPVRLNILIKKE